MSETVGVGVLLLVGLLLAGLRVKRLAGWNWGGGFLLPSGRERAGSRGGLVQGAGLAPVNPPDVWALLKVLPDLSVPIGWQGAGRSASLVYASLVGDVGHILITGQSGSGKDNLATGMLLGLALRNPDTVALCIIDGKGLDYVQWEGKAAVWRLAAEPADIAPALEALNSERARRGQLLRAAGVAKWEDYPDRRAMPLLVVYVAELTLLADVLGSVSKLENWLNPELAAARAYGIRYILSSQTVSNLSTRWRSQVSLFIAGFQPTASQDEPNASLTAPAILAAYGIPPSQLPAGVAGLFTAVQGRSAETVRASYIPAADLTYALSLLPDRPATGFGRAGLGAVPSRPAADVPIPVPTPDPQPDPVDYGNTSLNTGTGTEPPASKQQVQQRVKIRKALAAGLSVTDIAEIIGGNRTATFKLVKAVQAEAEAEAERETDHAT